MNNVVIYWDKDVFNNATLPNKHILYTQLYLENPWSLVFTFEKTPGEQGLESYARVEFLMDSAPKNILTTNFEFDFYDGLKIIGKCQIL